MLVELEREEMRRSHDLELARIRTQMVVQIAQAWAPGMAFRIVGGPDALNRVIGQFMLIGHAAENMAETPIGRLLGLDNTLHNSDGLNLSLPSFWSKLLPFVHKLVRGMNPRVLSSLTVAQMLDQLMPVLQGEQDLLSALNGLRESAQFRMIAEVPVQPLLEQFGLRTGANDETALVAAAAEAA